jgi:hypothetical protein
MVDQRSRRDLLLLIGFTLVVVLAPAILLGAGDYVASH